jgi:hypothetical protein
VRFFENVLHPCRVLDLQFMEKMINKLAFKRIIFFASLPCTPSALIFLRELPICA